jgi:hypothetical protein
LGHYLIVFCLGCSLFFACLYFYPKIKWPNQCDRRFVNWLNESIDKNNKIAN